MESPIKVYQWLLKLYPASFREEYGLPMERQFLDDYHDAQSGIARIAVGLNAMADLLVSVPKQIVHELRLDLKHAARLYRRQWVTTVMAVMALGLAIGMSTGVFSVLNALLLRSLPFSKPAQLTELWLSPFTAVNGRAGFDRWSESSPYLQDAATFSSSDMNLANDRGGFRVKAAETSADFFAVLGVEPVLGRTFSKGDDVFGQDAIAVISYGLWQQMFGGSPNITGTVLHVNGAPFTVVGVMPANFDYPAKTNVWFPSVFDFERVPKRGAFLFQTIGRLREGVTMRKARELFEAEARRTNPAAFPTAVVGDPEHRPRLVSLQDQLAGPVGRAARVLAGLTLLVLLIACANIAQVLLSRTIDRREELELRAALGAGRGRLLQQLITEALMLTLAGAVLGLFVAAWTTKIASLFAPAQLITQQYTILSWPVLVFATTVTVTMGVIIGSLPAWLLERLPRAGRTGKAGSARAFLVAVETACALCLVTGSLSMGRTFLQLLHADLGFRPASVLTLNVSLQGTRYNGAGAWQYYSQVIDRLRSVPGVEAAAAVGHLPLTSDLYMANSLQLDSGQKVEQVITNAVTPGYFRAMGTRILAGVEYAEGTRQHPAVIVNETFAQATGLGLRIVGRQLIAPWDGTKYAVVGVVSTENLSGTDSAGSAQVYWQIEEDPPPVLTLVASVQGQPADLLSRCRDAVRRADAMVPVYDVETLDQRLSAAFARPRFYTAATLSLALLALVLAVMGSYGTAAYSIAQRTREMGIRLAVGASYGRIRAMLMLEGLLPVLCGAFGGLLLSLLVSRYLEQLLPTASRPVIGASMASAGLLTFAGAVAVWSASNRILQIDPAEALRME